MTQHNAASASITNSDASPRVANTAGIGGASVLQYKEDFVVVPASADTTSIFRVVRVNSTAIVKDVYLESEAQTVGVVNVGVWYADSLSDLAPSNAANLGLVIDEDFFASLVDIGSAVAKTDVVNESGTYTLDKRQQPLWQAVGLTVDPGGKFDIGCKPSTSVTTGLGRLGIGVKYVTP